MTRRVNAENLLNNAELVMLTNFMVLPKTAKFKLYRFMASQKMCCPQPTNLRTWPSECIQTIFEEQQSRNQPKLIELQKRKKLVVGNQKLQLFNFSLRRVLCANYEKIHWQQVKGDQIKVVRSSGTARLSILQTISRTKKKKSHLSEEWQCFKQWMNGLVLTECVQLFSFVKGAGKCQLKFQAKRPFLLVQVHKIQSMKQFKLLLKLTQVVELYAAIQRAARSLEVVRMTAGLKLAYWSNNKLYLNERPKARVLTREITDRKKVLLQRTLICGKRLYLLTFIEEGPQQISAQLYSLQTCANYLSQLPERMTAEHFRAPNTFLANIVRRHSLQEERNGSLVIRLSEFSLIFSLMLNLQSFRQADKQYQTHVLYNGTVPRRFEQLSNAKLLVVVQTECRRLYSFKAKQIAFLYYTKIKTKLIRYGKVAVSLLELLTMGEQLAMWVVSALAKGKAPSVDSFVPGIMRQEIQLYCRTSKGQPLFYSAMRGKLLTVQRERQSLTCRLINKRFPLNETVDEDRRVIFLLMVRRQLRRLHNRIVLSVAHEKAE